MRQSKPVSVLLVEDEPADARRIQICLRQFKEIPFEVVRAGSLGETPKRTIDSRSRDMSFEVTWVTTLTEALQKQTEFYFDILILDLSLLGAQGLSTIHAASSIPIIVLIDRNDIDFVQTKLKAIAKDYIVKDDSGYGGLVRAMRYVLHRTDLETRNNLLVAALKATSNAVIITDRSAHIEWTNPAFTELTGYSFQEALGRRPSELLKSGVHDKSFYEQIWHKLQKGEHWQGEIINRHKNGSIYNAELNISPVFNSDASLSGYVQIQWDITDSVIRLTISEILQQRSPLDERFKQVLQVLFNLKAFDLQRKGGVFLRAKDEGHLNMFLLSEVLSEEFIEKDNRIKCGSCLCELVVASGALLVSDDCLCDPRHEHKFFDMQAHGHYIVPIASGGEVLGVLFLYTELYPLKSESRLTMLKQVGEMMALALRQEEAKTALETARDMAMQASLVKSEFLANMSHEIRTPMNGVLGMLELLRETKMTPSQLEWVETAHTSAEILLDIINDILDLSRVEAGKFEVEQVDFNLINLVEDICALLAGRAHTKELELNCLLPVTMPLRWQGDPKCIRQVLTNLIGNAVKFTLQGEVSVSVTWSSLSDNQNELRFEVHDTGIGIPAEGQLQLFQPFSQVDSTTSRRFGGSGLGLFISKKLVELMGGAIGMDSVPGKGSCFWFTLPLEQSERQDTSIQEYDLSGKRALIVDNNATNCTILNNYLGHWGLEVSEADNGSTALMILKASANQGVIYDLILLDIQMPVMDGLTLAKCLIQIPALAKIPVILLSLSDQIDLDDYQNTGIRQCLMKPVRQLQLFDAIVNALQGVSKVITNLAESEIQLPSYIGKKVLVVEDNRINQKVIIAKLAKFDIVPDVAENGHIALDKLAQSAYDLIFMDCQMSVMDGYNATRELRLLETSKGLPHQVVIALTANALEGELEKCLEAGMDDYLSKPIVFGQLMDMLAYHLGVQNPEIHPALGYENILLDEKSIIVWDEASALKHLEGDSNLLYEIIELYLMEGPKQLSALSRSQAEGNLLALANTAHTIKGSTALFYADTATACASLLEQTARSNQSADFQCMTEALVKAVTDLINNLQLTKNAKKQIR